MNILKILMFSGLSKPVSGVQNRFINMTRQLKNNGQNLTILEPQEYLDPQDNELGKTYTYRDPVIFRHQFKILRDISPNFISGIGKILNENKIDLIELSHPSGVLALKILTIFKKKRIKIVYDAHNVESDFVDGIVGQMELPRIFKVFLPFYIRLIERIAVNLVDHILCVSENDKNQFKDKYKLKDEKITVIPSGCSLHQTGDDKIKLKIKRKIDPEMVVILFHGTYAHPPNKEAFKFIINELAPKFTHNNLMFLLAGTGTPRFVGQNIRSYGFVEDISDIINMADIAIVPIKRGGGTKLKVLDYLGGGLPLITTSKGVEGLAVEDRENVIIANNQDEMVDSIKYLIENKDERDRIGQNARKLAEEHYDWIKIGKNLNDLYQKLIEE